MDISLANISLLLFFGVIAGFINSTAGGGSILTVPMLIFAGLPPTVANATNRIGVFVQGAIGIIGYRSKEVSAFPEGYYLGSAALFGAIIGTNIALDISDVLFNRILSITILLITLTTFIKKKGETHHIRKPTKSKKIIGAIIFFFIGVYGGLIQVGVGFLILSSLSSIFNFDLIQSNAIKLAVITIYTTCSLVIFGLQDKIMWEWGIILSIGTATGGWLGSRWAVAKGEKYIKWILVTMVIVIVLKVWM